MKNKLIYKNFINIFSDTKECDFNLSKKRNLYSWISLILLFFSISGYAQEVHHLSLEGSQGKLYAILQYPDKVEKDVKYPLVIICHGFTGNCISPIEKCLADDIVKKGMAALRFDFNGHGKMMAYFKI